MLSRAHGRGVTCFSHTNHINHFSNKDHNDHKTLIPMIVVIDVIFVRLVIHGCLCEPESSHFQ